MTRSEALKNAKYHASETSRAADASNRELVVKEGHYMHAIIAENARAHAEACRAWSTLASAMNEEDVIDDWKEMTDG